MSFPRSTRTVVERLSGDLLRDLRDDIRLLRATDTRVLFAVDSFDVLRYCFPLRPYDQSFPVDVSAQADYHAALSYVFDHRPWRPVLLTEYMVELHGFTASALERGSSRASVDAALRKELQGVLESSFAPGAAGVTFQFLEEHFSPVMLLMAAAANRVGFRELGRLVRSRLAPLANYAPDDADGAALHRAMQKFADSYRVDRGFVEHCERALQAAYENVDDPHGRGPRAQAASNRADSVALDRVVQLNAYLEGEHGRGSLPKRYRVLLLSSAGRMRRLVRHFDRVPESQPLPDAGAAQRVVRVPDQVFAYIVSQPVHDTPTAGESGDTVLRTLEWLVQLEEETNDLRSRTQRVRSCGQCVLDGHANSYCQSRELCERLALLEANRRDILTPYQNSSENLALLAAFGEYVREPSQYGGPQSAVIRGVLRMLSDERVLAMTREALTDRREVLLARTILAHVWCKLGRGEASDVYAAPTKDFIRGAHHAMPWVLSLGTPELRSVLDLARQAFFQHPDDPAARRESLAEAFGLLIQFDTGQERRTPRGQFESDLVRVVLFLALSDGDSIEAACVQSASLCRDCAADDRSDTLYVTSWAYRRAGRFKEAIEYASSGIDQFERDPRLWHARALAKYAQSTAAGQGAGPFAAASVMADFQTALRLFYSADLTDDLRTITVAGCLNALTYILTTDRSSADRLARARAALQSLKEVLPPERWDPSFPEFFHTEATLEVEEAKGLRGQARRAKLEHASGAAGRAREIARSRADYGQLVAAIDESLAALAGAPVDDAAARV